MDPVKYNKEADQVRTLQNSEVASFSDSEGSVNIDKSVVESFGEEWKKFKNFSKEEIDAIGDMYFDIVGSEIVNETSYCIDIGCGTGRWTKYLSTRAGFIEAVDPSEAILMADGVVGKESNVRLTHASVEGLPFNDETFDFGMSIGVLHHIPDTAKALKDCVKKIKKGGYFYVYLYYDFNNRGFLFKLLFKVSNFFRKIISKFPGRLKRFTCDLIAVFVYMPFVLLGRMFKFLGAKKVAKKMPLDIYQDTSFYIIRNDALDRFGTKLEQRFSKEEVIQTMTNAGLSNIVVSDQLPYWHAVGYKK